MIETVLVKRRMPLTLPFRERERSWGAVETEWKNSL
jgi:hypothetical protein